MHYGGTILLYPTILFFLTITLVIFRIIYSHLFKTVFQDVFIKKKMLNYATIGSILFFCLLKILFIPIQSSFISERMRFEKFNDLNTWTVEQRFSDSNIVGFYESYKKPSDLTLNIAYAISNDTFDKIVRYNLIIFAFALIVVFTGFLAYGGKVGNSNGKILSI